MVESQLVGKPAVLSGLFRHGPGQLHRTDDCVAVRHAREVPLGDAMNFAIDKLDLSPKLGKTSMMVPYLIGYQAYINRLGFVGEDLDRML